MKEKQSLPQLKSHEISPVQDHCGILTAYSPVETDFFSLGFEGFQRLQSRGSDGAGLVTLDIDQIRFIHKGPGMIEDVFTEGAQREAEKVQSRIWTFQTRYGTNGELNEKNVQPLLRKNKKTGELAVIAHNGQFAKESGLEEGPQSDTVDFANQLAETTEDNWDDRITNLLRKKEGAWSLTISVQDKKTSDLTTYLTRDKRGIRPLYYGEVFDHTGSQIWVAASETRALEEIGVMHFYEVMPGELVKITKNDLNITKIDEGESELCIFENVYTHKGESHAFLPRYHRTEVNQAPLVKQIRYKSGAILAREAPIDPKNVDFVVGIPGTAIPGGHGYAHALGLLYEQVIRDKKEKDNERTFMHGDITQILRIIPAHFNYDAKKLKGARIVAVDDSLVRGNMTKALIKILREDYGVAEVHLRILSPVIDKSCHRGIATRERDELVAANVEDRLMEINGDFDLDELVEGIRQEVNADTLVYLSSRGLREAQTGNPEDNRFCMGCMVGHSPSVDKYGTIVSFTKKPKS